MRLHRRHAVWIALAALLIPLSACTATPTADMGVIEMPMQDLPTQAMDSMVSAESTAQVIHQAWLDIEVQNIDDGVADVTQIVADFDGRIEQRSLNRGDAPALVSASLQVRVPSAQLSEVITELSKIGTVNNETTNATDVTMQHTDLSARVASLTGSIERLETLLAEASNVTDLIEVESALAQRQAELDSLSAQLEMLTDEVQYANIGLSLTTEKSPVASGSTSFWDALVAGFWSIVTALNGLVIFLGYALPWIAVIGIIALVIWGVVRSRRRRK